MASTNTDYSKYYASYIEKLKQKAAKQVRAAQDATWAEFFDRAEVDIRDMFNDVVKEFYLDYEPLYYDRRESLYDLLYFRSKKTGTGRYLEFGFDPSNMTHFRSGYGGEDGLYDQVFRKGWHGGADKGGEDSGKPHPDPGTPYWRKPQKGERYTWWGRAARIADVSPLDNMKRRMEDYNDYYVQGIYTEIWNRNKKKIRI